MFQMRSLFFACLFLSLSPWVIGQNDIDRDLKKLEKFLESLDRQYVDDVETQRIVEEGIKRMLEELDPHSVYLDKEAYERANEPLKGKFKGIGVRFLMVNDTMTILDLIDGGAAEAAGMRMGDQVIAINGDTVSGKELTTRNIGKKIKQQEQDDIAMLVKRPLHGIADAFSMNLKRNVVEVSSVPAVFMVDDRTGYIKLSRFSSSSYDDFTDGLEELNEERIKNLIVDLRGNGGGYLTIANKIADEFLDDRKLIVYTEGLHQDRRETFANSGGRYTDGALYLLIDANSASASEILAGAIQDLDRGLIIGRRSYGKGLVQRTVEFNDGSAMRLTISRYYTPTGRSIQRPYEDGLDAYRSEIRNRRLSGELYSADSISVADSLIYYTPLKRKVYGGGGIVPDVFVPLDTTSYPQLVLQMNRKGLFDGYALKLVTKERRQLLEAHRDIDRFIRDFRLEDRHYDQLTAYATNREVEIDPEELVEAMPFLEERVKVRMARFLYGYEAYYQAAALYDEDIKAALHEIDQGTVRELGLR